MYFIINIFNIYFYIFEIFNPGENRVVEGFGRKNGRR